jgi:hypothetical protein
MLLAAETQDPGWAHLVGLMIASAIAFIGVWTHRWWMDYRGHSPTPPDGDEIDVTPGETDDLTPDDTTDDTDRKQWWWRERVPQPDGSILVRPWHGHAADSPVEDDEIDLDLEGGEEETREEMADRLVAGRGNYADWVREIMNAFNVSEATAKRAIRDARERIDA